MRPGAWLLALSCLLGPSPAQAHHLEQSRLELRPLRQGELRGRFLLSPEAFPTGESTSAAVLLTRLRASFELSIAGVRCIAPPTVIELWTEASPSPGHLVDVRCSAPEGARPLQVAIVWHDSSELLVSYPGTETTATVSLLLTRDAPANVLVAEMSAPPATPQAPRADPAHRPAPAEPRWLSLASVALAGAVCVTALAFLARRPRRTS